MNVLKIAATASALFTPVLAMGAVSVGADAASTGRCTKPEGYGVVARSREAVVFRRRFGLRAYGCLRSRGKLVRLFYATGNYKLAGPYVAYLPTLRSQRTALLCP
jgi:hypothetical protein